MKKFTLSVLVFACSFFLIEKADGQEWNMSSDSFNALGEMTSTVTVEGLTIYAASDKVVTVDANNKSLDGVDYTHRLKLGGAGTFDDDGKPVSRVIAFNVTGNTTITIIGMSSSSSENRELIIAVDSMSNELGRFSALGTPISKGEFNYVGKAATIYLLSASGGVNLYHLKAAPTISSEQIWNISSEAFNALGTVSSTTTVVGLTIHAASDKTVVIDANNKSLDGMDFTHRLKLGGSGSFDENGMPISRVVSFNVAGNTAITIMAMSSSGSEDRILNIAVDSMNGKLAEYPVLGASLTKGEFTYTGKPAKIFLYSPSSGVNIYYIKAVALSTRAEQIFTKKEVVNVYPNPADDKIYIDYGQPIRVAVYNMAGVLVKSKMIHSKHEYIGINDLQPGVYLIRSQNDNTFAKKIIKK
jgi:hypothetical protein